MAEIAVQESYRSKNGTARCYGWPSVGQSDTCAAVQIDEFDDLTISLHGTPDGASVALHLSNDGTNYFAAKDMLTGSAIALTTADTAALVAEGGVWAKPVPTGAGASADMWIAVGTK